MKAFIKIIWLYIAFILRGYVMQYTTVNSVTKLVNKLNENSPINLTNFDIESKLIPFFNNLNNVVFMTILFLGLDIISGDVSGVIKGPFKLVFNLVIYVVGFTILFYIIGSAIDLSFLNAK